MTLTSWQRFEHDVIVSARTTKGWRPTAARYGISVAVVKRIVKNNARRERLERAGTDSYPLRHRDTSRTNNQPTTRQDQPS